MCSVAVVNGIECETAGELLAQIGNDFQVVKESCYQSEPIPEQCLCGVDVFQTAMLAGYECQKEDNGTFVLTLKQTQFNEK